MRISGLTTDEQVFVNGRGRVRLLDLMAEAGVPYQQVGFPKRRYYRSGGMVLICGQHERPYQRIDLSIPDQTFAPDARPQVVSSEPVPYFETYGDVYEYEPWKLSPWSKRRKERPAAFPKGYVIFEVLGWADDHEHLRLKLPHKAGEWQLHHKQGRWLDRVPSPLEVRIQELWIEDAYRDDHRHPLSSGKYLREDARKERDLLTCDGEPFSVLAVEEWEELRQHAELSVDEAIIAISMALLSRLEDRGTTYYSGPFESQVLEQYRKATWTIRDPKDVLERMGTLYTVEREMLRGAMQAVACTRRFYSREAFDKMMGA